MISLAETNWQRTLSIPERAGLPGDPRVRSGEANWLNWKRLAIFRRRGVDIKSALMPLRVTEEKLRILVDETEESLLFRSAGMEPPKWAEQLIVWWNRHADGQDSQGTHGFLNLVEDIVNAAVDDMLAGVEGLSWPEVIDRDILFNGLVESVPTELLFKFITPTMVLHYNRNYRSNGLNDFYKVCTEEWFRRQILSDYPMVWKKCVIALMNWVRATIIFAERLISDWDDLVNKFGNNGNSTNVELHANMGDPHGGATVIVLEACGVKCVYKPRPPDGEIILESTVGILDRAGIPDLPYTLTYVPRPEYYWEEFVETTDVSQENAALLARQLGSLTAILYALQADDMHHENVCIGKKGISVIDSECVVHPIRPIDFETLTQKNPVSSLISCGAHTIGIVPQPLVSNNENRNRESVADISVFGYRADERTTFKVPQFRIDGVDNVRVVTDDAVFDDADPVAGRQLLIEYRSDFITSFTRAYRGILENSDDFEMLVERASRSSFRVVCRPTMIYAKVQIESCPPDFMTDGAAHDLCLSKLLLRFEGLSSRSNLIAAEIGALRAGAIPLVSICLGTGEFNVDGYRFKSGFYPMERLLKHVSNMSEQDLARQRYLLEIAFGLLISDACQTRPRISFDAFSGSDELKLEAANDILTWVSNHVYIVDGVMGYPIMIASAPNQWSISPSGFDLYNGLAGMSLMLNLLEDESRVDTRRLADIADSTLVSFRRLLENDKGIVIGNREILNAGAFDQVAGMAIHALTGKRLRATPEGKGILADALTMLDSMVSADRNSDVISGAAGSIMVALASLDDSPTAAERLATHAYAKLRSMSVSMGDGKVAWPGSDGVPLAGFSHGAVGIAVSISRLWTRGMIPEDEARKFVSGALRWEHTVYTPGHGWCDMREDADTRAESSMQNWCHGAAGAALARIELLDMSRDLLDDDLYVSTLKELQDAAAITRAFTRATIERDGSDCLCHGTIGNLLIMERLAGYDDINLSREEVDDLWRLLLKSKADLGWRSGGVPNSNSLSFMMGLPGIAWGLVFSVRDDPQFDALSLSWR